MAVALPTRIKEGCYIVESPTLDELKDSLCSGKDGERVPVRFVVRQGGTIDKDTVAVHGYIESLARQFPYPDNDQWNFTATLDLEMTMAALGEDAQGRVLILSALFNHCRLAEGMRFEGCCRIPGCETLPNAIRGVKPDR